MSKFERLGVRKDLVKGISEMNIKNPTEIQEKVIPLLVSGTPQLIGQANTGTGKTAAYGLPLLMQINPEKDKVQGLILCPTRELCQQVAKQLFKYTKYSDKIFTEAVYGGDYIGKQISALQRTTHIIVATPGRLIDLVKREAIDLMSVKTVILDEADEMLSMGFKKELDEILSFLPKAKNKWLFSATMPIGILDIIKYHMSPTAVRIKQSSGKKMNENIVHQYYVCDEIEKLQTLVEFLKYQRKARGMVFCRTKEATKKLTKQLQERKIATDSIHGDLLQKERTKVMRAFKNKNLQILIATDVAARGLDIEALSYVVHYELPESEEYFTHRSGRTARAGRTGLSFCIVKPNEVKVLRKYESNLRIKFQKIK